LLYKIAILFVGYLLARLGHELLKKGISGEFKFRAEMKGVKADLVSASPGLFFILMATVVIAVGVFRETPFETSVGCAPEKRVEDSREQDVDSKSMLKKPELPDKLPGR
jgi:hypothetical protein